jgi:hypothetical protein
MDTRWADGSAYWAPEVACRVFQPLMHSDMKAEERAPLVYHKTRRLTGRGAAASASKIQGEGGVELEGCARVLSPSSAPPPPAKIRRPTQRPLPVRGWALRMTRGTRSPLGTLMWSVVSPHPVCASISSLMLKEDRTLVSYDASIGLGRFRRGAVLRKVAPPWMTTRGRSFPVSISSARSATLCRMRVGRYT